MDLSKLKLVEVEWKDATDWNNNRVSPEEALKRKASIQKSVGYLLEENDKRVVIAKQIEIEDDEIVDMTIIPKGWFKTRELSK